MGPVDSFDLEDGLAAINKKPDFNGLLILANFALYPPYCIIDKGGEIKGLLYDVLKIVTRELNLSLEIRRPKPQNKGIWFKK